jgi:hypothetical protein
MSILSINLLISYAYFRSMILARARASLLSLPPPRTRIVLGLPRGVPLLNSQPTDRAYVMICDNRALLRSFNRAKAY